MQKLLSATLISSMPLEIKKDHVINLFLSREKAQWSLEVINTFCVLKLEIHRKH